jgi:hypothetical protein
MRTQRPYKPQTKNGLPHHNTAKPLTLRARVRDEDGKTTELRGLPSIDGRTRAGRAAKQFRKELTEYLGGSPSIIERTIIDRCVWLSIKVSLMDQKIAEGRDTEYDSKTYLAWSNSLQRSLLKIGYRESVEIMRKRAEQQLMQTYNRKK